MNYLTAILAMTITLFSGGAIAIDQPLQHNVPQPSVEASIPNASGAFQYVSLPYPKEVEAAFNNLRQTGGSQVVQGDKQTYVVISLGQRSTGGYRVVVDGVKPDAKGNLIVSAHEVKPAPGKMTIQVITYPSTVIAIPKTTLPVTVNVK